MIRPSTNWIQIRIKPLMEHIDKLIKSIQSYPSSVCDEMIDGDLNYFDDNIKGLGKVLNSESETKKR